MMEVPLRHVLTLVAVLVLGFGDVLFLSVPLRVLDVMAGAIKIGGMGERIGVERRGLWLDLSVLRWSSALSPRLEAWEKHYGGG